MFMKKVVAELQVEELTKENSNAWPFIEPVSGVPDYYDVIKNPMGIPSNEIYGH
jgi:histone acetyltransferase